MTSGGGVTKEYSRSIYRQVMAQTFIQEAAHTQCFLRGRVTVIVTLGYFRQLLCCCMVIFNNFKDRTNYLRSPPPQHLAMSPSHLPRYIIYKSYQITDPQRANINRSLPPPNGKLSKPAVHVQQAKIHPEIPTGEVFFHQFYLSNCL